MHQARKKAPFSRPSTDAQRLWYKSMAANSGTNSDARSRPRVRSGRLIMWPEHTIFGIRWSTPAPRNRGIPESNPIAEGSSGETQPVEKDGTWFLGAGSRHPSARRLRPYHRTTVGDTTATSLCNQSEKRPRPSSHPAPNCRQVNHSQRSSIGLGQPTFNGYGEERKKERKKEGKKEGKKEKKRKEE